MLNIHTSKCWVSRDASGNANFVTGDQMRQISA